MWAAIAAEALTAGAVIMAVTEKVFWDYVVVWETGSTVQDDGGDR